MTDKKHTKEHHHRQVAHEPMQAVSSSQPLTDTDYMDMALSFYRQQDGKRSVQVMDEYYRLKEQIASGAVADVTCIDSNGADEDFQVGLPQEQSEQIQVNADIAAEKTNQINLDGDLNALLKELAIQKEKYQDSNRRLTMICGGNILTGGISLFCFITIFSIYESTGAKIISASLMPWVIGALWSGISAWKRFELPNNIAKAKLEQLKQKIFHDGKAAILFNEEILKMTQNMSDAEKHDYLKQYDNIVSIENPEVIYDLIGHSRINVRDFMAEDIKEYFQTQKHIQTMKEELQSNNTFYFLCYLGVVWLSMLGMDIFSHAHFGFQSFMDAGFLGLIGSIMAYKIKLKKYQPLQALNEKLAQAKKNLKALKQYLPGKKIIVRKEL